mmetsp:Transcript_31916/g.77783  ORF Transcript_31916/g.77783 Transcript_31916/m.77783 type:complete len:232 (+) Transcript_31916:199-894(+)
MHFRSIHLTTEPSVAMPSSWKASRTAPTNSAIVGLTLPTPIQEVGSYLVLPMDIAKPPVMLWGSDLSSFRSSPNAQHPPMPLWQTILPTAMSSGPCRSSEIHGQYPTPNLAGPWPKPPGTLGSWNLSHSLRSVPAAVSLLRLLGVALDSLSPCVSSSLSSPISPPLATAPYILATALGVQTALEDGRHILLHNSALPTFTKRFDSSLPIALRHHGSRPIGPRKLGYSRRAM